VVFLIIIILIRLRVARARGVVRERGAHGCAFSFSFGHAFVLHAVLPHCAQAGTVCSAPNCPDSTVVRPVVRAGCGCALHDTRACRPTDDQCPTCAPRYDAIVKQLCDGRNELVERLAKELAGENVSDDAADDDECEDEDEDDVLHVGDDADEPFLDIAPEEITSDLFQQQLQAALAKW
jgi:hypothetical protein